MHEVNLIKRGHHKLTANTILPQKADGCAMVGVNPIANSEFVPHGANLPAPNVGGGRYNDNPTFLISTEGLFGQRGFADMVLRDPMNFVDGDVAFSGGPNLVFTKICGADTQMYISHDPQREVGEQIVITTAAGPSIYSYESADFIPVFIRDEA